MANIITAATHSVFNQSAPRVDVNEYTSNTALTEAVASFAPSLPTSATDQLTAIGAEVGSASYQHDAELANTITPVHHSHDRWGNRVDDVEFHPGYHRIMGYSINQGLHTSAWADPGPGANVLRAAGFMLVSQVEPGHGCPVSMTHAVVPALRTSPGLAEFWEPRLLSRNYDPELRDPATKDSAIFGMAMTEKQGGSDVRANTTRAVPNGDGTWSLTGHKWFCSAPQSDAFLVLAQTDVDGGSGAEEKLSCFLVPRILPGEERNVFNVQRLKDKLGNKSNSSSEVEFNGTVGWLVGEPGRGVRTIIEMVNRTRLDCVYGSAAGLRQGVAEAAWHARHRAAFGATLIDQPAMSNVIADLQLEAEAATWTALRLAAAHDDDSQEDFRRLATAVSKYWVCKRGPHHAYESLECLGGNGYTELFPLARRYREAPVNAVWEGSGNVIALDVLRAMAKQPSAASAFIAELDTAAGRDERYDAQLARTKSLFSQASSSPADAPAIARRLVESMALTLQAQILLTHAPAPVAEAYLAGRVDPTSRGMEYGTLPPEVDVTALAARA
ncbi:MAG TPA: acyl-CoA dehydrogenase family protein [Candidatus Corynebacterium avicola]|uniref:Acyl-CoA dehydrogenase family protein n=1 Tax=Candidatus Corynebacterium avicola TaxID=2838527 RepID=A0A9D1RQ58_9CORY|nr:acyl-CoA dehydrogenase family protein [Candidatus Corynebacterium avicola]